MDKKIIGILLIAILATVFIASYFLFGQPNQAGNTTNSPSPEPTPTPVESPSEEPAPTESAPLVKPSVPEFTWEFVDYSYDTPPTYEIDPYTGESVMTEPSYHIDNRSIVVTIKNQLFTPYRYANGTYTRLYYGIRIKGHYENEWSYAPDPHYYGYYNASDSGYTVIAIRLASYGAGGVSSGGKVDFQVEALIGYDNRIPTMTPWGESCYYEFTGETSGWSSTQTITIP